MAGEYISRDRVNGYLCRAADAQGAGMLLLPHVTGIEPEMKDEAQMFADAGFTTLVWDPYPGFDLESGQKPPQCVDETCVADQMACTSYAFEQLGVQRLGMIGWCMGGRMALTLAARERRLAAAVAYYPSIREARRAEEIDAVSIAGEIRCPLQVVYPGKDHVTSNATFAALRAQLDTCPGPVAVQVYPEAVHGFMGRVGESEANAQAGRLAWPQTMAFLKAAVKG
jgi:carboxymethylenebutenolidase